MVSVCVTGGAGYIGDAAVDHLLTSGATVTVLDNLMYGGAYMRRHPNLQFVRGDIRDTRLLDKLIQNHDAILHLAAIVGDGACAANPDLTTEVNEVAVKNIATLCMLYNKALTFASTCSVYGANNDLLDEDSPTNPLSLYAGTKLKAEDYVRQVSKHFIFRLGTLFGLSTEHGRLRNDLVTNILTYKACAGQKLTVYGGEQWRPLLHVRDAAELMARATFAKPIGHGTYILSYCNTRIIDMARMILDVCGLPKNQMDITDMKFEDLRNYRVAPDRRGKFFIPRFSLEHGITEIKEAVDEGRIADVWDKVYHNAKYVKEVPQCLNQS